MNEQQERSKYSPTGTLHRGLRKELPKRMYNDRLDNFITVKPNIWTKSRARNYKTMINFLHQFYKDCIIWEEEANDTGRPKDKYYFMLVLTSTTQEPALGLIGIVVPYRNPTARDSKFTPYEFTVTDHALERIYQRIGTTDHSAALQEVKGVALAFASDKQIDSHQTWEIGTGNGIAILRTGWDEDAMTGTVITWIDKAKLRPEQSAEYMAKRLIEN